jgi:hypothetical protein
MIIDKWWPDLEGKVTAVLADPELQESTRHKRDQSDVLKEVLLRIRNIQRALEDGTGAGPAPVSSEPSIRGIIEKAFARLSPGQIEIMWELVTETGKARVLDAAELESRYSKAVVDSLLQYSLIRRENGFVMVAHDLIASYIAKKRAS